MEPARKNHMEPTRRRDGRISVLLQLQNRDLIRQLSAQLQDEGSVRLLGTAGNGGPSSAGPDVVILEDAGQRAETFAKLQVTRERLPNAAVFVVSEDKDPEHIVEVMRRGAAEYLLLPFSLPKLQAALDRLCQPGLGAEPRRQGKVYSFISSKGGLGATVLTVNLAAALAMQKAGKVAVLDNSFSSGDSSVLLDLVPERTIADVFRHYRRLDADFLRGAMTTHPLGFQVLPAPNEPDESVSVHADKLANVLELARGLYDHSLVDCKSMSLDPCSLEAFKASDRIFVVTDLSVPAVRNASRLTQAIQKLNAGADKVEVVVNRFVKKAGPSLKEIEKSMDRRVYWLFPNDFGDVVDSINQGVPLVKQKPGNVFSKSVKEFVRQLADPSPDDSYRGVRGFLRQAL